VTGVAEFSPNQLARSARRVFTDPRLVGVAQALPRTAAVLRRARPPHGTGGIPGVPVSAGLAAQVLLDEVLISVMRDPRLFPHGDDYERAGDDIRTAYQLWGARGWLDHPERYHSDPPVPGGIGIARERAVEQRYEHLTFESGYEPPAGVPRREEWLAHVENRTGHAWIMRHADPTAPWLVCLHGFGMGHASMDLRGFRSTSLHWDQGVNLALVVLPLHGPRQAPGAHRGEGFMNIDLIDSVHGLAQSAWDARSVIRWIRVNSAPGVAVGVYGVSLGGYVASLVASLEDGLSAAVAGIPATDLPDLYRRHATPRVRERALAAGALGPEADAVHSVVSPLVLAPKVPRDHRYIFAGVGDRMSTAGQARRLWEHWDRCSIEWYRGGHIGFFMAGGVQRYINGALAASGLSRSQPGRSGGTEPSAAGSLSSLPPAS